MNSEPKTCGSCNEAKPILAFPRNGKDLHGTQLFRPDCMMCDRIRQRAGWEPGLTRKPVVNRPSERLPDRKTCTSCGDEKALEFFGMAGKRQGVQRRASHCKACRNTAYNARRAASPDDSRDSDLWKRYRITLAQYTEVLARQDGCCLICGTHESESHKRFCVDHDHACCPGEVTCGTCLRGLLCGPCNRGLGAFGDNPGALRAAAGYVENSKIRLEVA